MIRFTVRRPTLKSVALPLLAVLAFSFGLAAQPGSGGGFGVSIADAKGKGGKGGEHAKGKGGKGGKHAKVRETGGNGHAKKTHKGHGHAAKDDRRQRDTTRQTARSDRHAERRYEEGDTARRGREERDAMRHSERDGMRHAERGDARTEETYDDRSWGATASQLKHRNAANASESAFRNASEKSNVGRISAYRDAARATIDKERDIEALDLEIENLRVRRSLAENDGYYDQADALTDRITELEHERRLAGHDLHDLRVAEQDAYESVGGPELDDHDYAVFRSMLGLD